MPGRAQGKKLTEAAEALYGRRRAPSEGAIRDAERFFGKDSEAVRDLEARQDARVVEIHPDNLDVFRLFQASLTQWRHAGMSGVATGLDYGAVAVAAKGIGVALEGEVFEGLQLMESVALKAMMKSAKKG